MYDPKLCVASGEIHFVSNNLVRFLGGTIQVAWDPMSAKEAIKEKLSTLCIMVREYSRPHGNSLCEEVGRPSQTSRPSQTLLTSRQWRPSVLYQKLQVGKTSLLITSLDAGVNHIVWEALKKEGKQQHVKFQPYTIAQESFSSDPGASRKTVSRMAKKKVEKEQHEKRLKHSTSLNVQGRLFTITIPTTARLWAKSTFHPLR